MTMKFFDDNVGVSVKECKMKDSGPCQGGKCMLVGSYEWAKKERFKNWIRGLYRGFDRRRWMWVRRMAICMVVGGRGGILCAKCRSALCPLDSFFESLT